MKKLSALLLTLGFAVSTSACIIATGPKHKHRSSGVAKSECRPSQYWDGEKCRPSQYWDGEKCRHKGKGHGARKHDGR